MPILVIIDDPAKSPVGPKQEHAGGVVHGIVILPRHFLECCAEFFRGALDLGK